MQNWFIIALFCIFLYLICTSKRSAMIKITLRRKAISGNRSSLYLDFYPAVTIDGKKTRREFLGAYLYDKPRLPVDKEHNIETLKLAEMKQMKRYNELNKPEIYNEFEMKQLRITEIGELSFSEYFDKFVSKRQNSDYVVCTSALKHFKAFAGKDLKFSDITEKFCNEFLEYITGAVNVNSTLKKKHIASNTASLYFAKFKSVLRQAYKDGLLQTDLNSKIKPIKMTESQRNYLTMDELNKLIKTPCAFPILKRAVLFSALTGLRFSDISKLTWQEVAGVDGNYSLNFTQRKTGGVESLPISEQAVSLLGENSGPKVRPFEGLQYTKENNRHLEKWITAAGITKKITFHCFRHTFATLQLSNGTDIYTVSKLLGHRNLTTTQIYAKVIDKSKREAINRIVLEL